MVVTIVQQYYKNLFPNMKITASILPTTIIAVTVVLFCFTTEQQHQHRFVSASFRGAVKNIHDQNGNDELFLGLGLARPTGRALQDIRCKDHVTKDPCKKDAARCKWRGPKGAKKCKDKKCKDHVKGGHCKKDKRCKWSGPKGKKKTCKDKPKTCEQTTKKTKCQQMNKKCHWSSGQPMCQTNTGSCSDWERSDWCRAHDCAWKKNTNTCVKKIDPKCSTLGIEQCDAKTNRCKWLNDSSTCVDKDDGKGWGCYFLNGGHQCHCNDNVCTESLCLQQEQEDWHQHLWTDGCGSCRCDCTSGSYEEADCKIKS